MSFFPPPVATNAMLTACVTTGSVSVIRFGGGLGESLTPTTQASSSRSWGWPGNKLQVWPSGPTPSRIRSKMGILTLSLAANERLSSSVYRSASSVGSSSWTCFSSMGMTLGAPS